MHYTSIAYKSNNKVYIGHIGSGLKEIELFKPLSGVNNIFNENMIYIVMCSVADGVIRLYELEKIPTISLFDVSITKLSEDDLIAITNKLLNQYIKSIVLH